MDIKSLTGQDNLDEFLQERGVIAKVHVGRIRNYIEVTPGMFGVDETKSIELKEFTKEHLKNGSLTFIPNGYEKRLKKVESRVRITKSRMAIGFEGDYMTLATYKEFKKYVQDACKEYLSIRDEILLNWDGIVTNFKMLVRKSLEDMNALNREIIYNTIISKIPSRDQYAKSFYMEAEPHPLPSTSVNILDEDIAEDMRNSVKKNSIKAVYEILGSALQDAFDVVNSCLQSYDKNDRIANKTLTSLREAGSKIKKKNLFGNEMVESIINDINKLKSLEDSDDIASECEVIASKIYGYAGEIDVILNIRDSVLEESQLDTIYRAIKANVI